VEHALLYSTINYVIVCEKQLLQHNAILFRRLKTILLAHCTNILFTIRNKAASYWYIIQTMKIELIHRTLHWRIIQNTKSNAAS